MKIAARVAYYERGTDRVPFYLGAREAAIKLGLGLLEVRVKVARIGVIAVQSSGIAVHAGKLGARAGSLGILREHLPSGHVVFQHHNSHPELLAA